MIHLSEILRAVRVNDTGVALRYCHNAIEATLTDVDILAIRIGENVQRKCCAEFCWCSRITPESWYHWICSKYPVGMGTFLLVSNEFTQSAWCDMD